MNIEKIKLQTAKIVTLEEFVTFLNENWEDERTYFKVAFSDMRAVCPLLTCFDSIFEGDDVSGKKEFIDDLVALVEKHVERLKKDLEKLVTLA